MLYCLKIRSGNMEYLRLTPKDDIGKEINDKKNPCLIYLEKGEYRQKIEIKRSGVTVTGAGDETKIIFGDYAKRYTRTEKNTTLSALTHSACPRTALR